MVNLQTSIEDPEVLAEASLSDPGNRFGFYLARKVDRSEWERIIQIISMLSESAILPPDDKEFDEPAPRSDEP